MLIPSTTWCYVPHGVSASTVLTANFTPVQGQSKWVQVQEY